MNNKKAFGGPVGANPSHFAIGYAETDRVRTATPLSVADVNHLYLAQLSHQFRPVRTLDPDHRATTATSTSFVHLLEHPRLPVQKLRSAIVCRPMQAQLPPLLQDTQLRVRCDAFHIGDRCVKRNCAKGLCDLCYFLLGSREPETLSHILEKCPFATPVVTAVHRAFLATTQPAVHAATLQLGTAAFVRRFERRIVFGVADFEPGSTGGSSEPGVPLAVLAAATNHCLLSRRHHNATNVKAPLQHSAAAVVSAVSRLLCQTATAMRTCERRVCDRIYTHFEGWQPDPTPLEEWRKSWVASSIVNDTRPRTTLAFPIPLAPTPGVQPEPVIDLTDASTVTRLAARNPPRNRPPRNNPLPV